MFWIQERCHLGSIKIWFDVINIFSSWNWSTGSILLCFKLCSLDTIQYSWFGNLIKLEVKLHKKHRVVYLAYNVERTYRKCHVELGGGWSKLWCTFCPSDSFGHGELAFQNMQSFISCRFFFFLNNNAIRFSKIIF